MTPLSKKPGQADANTPGDSRAGGVEDEPPQPASLGRSSSRGAAHAVAGGVSIQYDITDTTGRLDDGALGWLERFGLLAIAEVVGEDVGPHVVALSVVDDARMSELHLFHSGIAGTTDVLTFDLREGVDSALDVEIVACLDEALRQTDGRAVERELLLYLLHGALHCLGYDDHNADDFERIHEREDEILREIGVGAVFEDGGDDAGEDA